MEAHITDVCGGRQLKLQKLEGSITKQQNLLTKNQASMSPIPTIGDKFNVEIKLTWR
jgi:hypothetical protein